MKNHANAGFTLLEVAITLIILGILAGAAMPSVLRYKQHANNLQTKENQEMVARAIAGFELAYKRLPCPADPSAQGHNIGIERPTCNENSTAKGIIPYKTLGLPASFAIDGYKRFMTYVTSPKANQHSVCDLRREAPLHVTDENGPVIRDEGIVALVLISHGPTGHGAFTGRGSEKMTGMDASPEEQVNTDDSLNYYALSYRAGPHPFRQTVLYASGDYLRSLAKHPCTPEEKLGDDRLGNNNPY